MGKGDICKGTCIEREDDPVYPISKEAMDNILGLGVSTAYNFVPNAAAVGVSHLPITFFESLRSNINRNCATKPLRDIMIETYQGFVGEKPGGFAKAKNAMQESFSKHTAGGAGFRRRAVNIGAIQTGVNAVFDDIDASAPTGINDMNDAALTLARTMTKTIASMALLFSSEVNAAHQQFKPQMSHGELRNSMAAAVTARYGLIWGSIEGAAAANKEHPEHAGVNSLAYGCLAGIGITMVDKSAYGFAAPATSKALTIPAAQKLCAGVGARSVCTIMTVAAVAEMNSAWRSLEAYMLGKPEPSAGHSR